MYNISRFLGMAAERYNVAEAGVVARAASLGSVTALNAGVGGVGAVNAGAYKGTAQGKVEGKKWYQANWFKLAVGAAVVGAAVAVAVTVGGPILIGAAVGAAMGAGVGGVIGGISSATSGGKFIDGFANGFMVGSISGALSGAASGAGFGLITGAALDGAVDSAVYAGETLYNGEEVTAAGVLTSFVVGAGFSVIGTVVSNKISGIVSKNVSEVPIKVNLSKAEVNTCDSIKKIINDNGYSVDEFIKLLHPDRVLNDRERLIVNSIRDQIGIPSAGTTMTKAIPQSDIYKYLYNPDYKGVKGFMAVKEHGVNLRTLNEQFEGVRLDYNNTEFKVTSGVDGISKSVGPPDNFYGSIEYTLNDTSKISIPNWEAGANNYPFTGRGFTGSNNIVLAEYTQEMRKFSDGDILNIRDAKTGEVIFKYIYDADTDEKWIMIGGK